MLYPSNIFANTVVIVSLYVCVVIFLIVTAVIVALKDVPVTILHPGPSILATVMER